MSKNKLFETRNPVDVFEEGIIPEPNTGCWLWTKSIGGPGYGQFTHKYRVLTTHRWAYEYFKGPIPKGMCVCHKCDTRACNNPDHLFLGTRKENQQDANRKGRLSRGEKFPNSKLSNMQVLEIKRRLSAGERPVSIVKDFNVSVAAIYDIKVRRKWAWLDA